MLEIELVNTELGSIAIVIKKQITNDSLVYCGSLLNNEHSIYIEAYDRETCLNKVVDAFDIAMLFWVKSQLPNDLFKRSVNEK